MLYFPGDGCPRNGVPPVKRMGTVPARYADPFAQRRARHEAHLVEDSLFTYYTLKARGSALAPRRRHTAGCTEPASWRFYRPATEQESLTLRGSRGSAPRQRLPPSSPP